MNIIYLFKLIILINLIFFSKFLNNSNIIKINFLLGFLLLISNNPYLYHLIHIFGSIQIITGWLWMNKTELFIYRVCIIELWLLFLYFKKKCILNKVIRYMKKQNKNYNNIPNNLNIPDELTILSPILILLTYI